MGLTVYWTFFAKRELRKIFDYYKEAAGKKIAVKVTFHIIQATEQIQLFPQIGLVESLLSHRPKTIRFFIYGNYKIIYWVNEPKNRIEILDIFDTRQDPSKLHRRK
jgi:plasmid stabilization system protein ParE